MQILFIGGGNMASALIGGLLKQGFTAREIEVVEPVADARTALERRFGVRCHTSPPDGPLAADVVVLAVKPQQMKDVCAGLAGRLGDGLVVSIAAGLRLADIGRWLGGHALLVRTMPNTPALVGAGVTGLCAAPGVTGVQRELANRILSAVGATVWIEDEGLMDAVTAVSGSGPAYVFHFIEGLIAAGEKLGLSSAQSRTLAIETVLGAALLARASEEPVSVLRERVTSKGGTTERALQSFAADGLLQVIERAVCAAEERGRELGDILGNP